MFVNNNLVMKLRSRVVNYGMTDYNLQWLKAAESAAVTVSLSETLPTVRQDSFHSTGKETGAGSLCQSTAGQVFASTILYSGRRNKPAFRNTVVVGDMSGRLKMQDVKLLLYVEDYYVFLLLTVRLPGCNESYRSVIVIVNRKCAFTNEIAYS